MKSDDKLILGHEKNPFKKIDSFIQSNILKSKKNIQKLVDSSAKGMDSIGNPLNYFETFMRDKGVAAIHPSSVFLVNRVVRAMQLPHARRIVEFGAAEGNITKKILKGLHPEGFILAIEKNDNFYGSLAALHDSRLKGVHGDIRDFRKIMDASGIGQVDRIVSGVPFSFFESSEREKLMKEVYGSLVHGGRFVAYQCTTHLIPVIRRIFPKMQVELEIRNLPPHFVYTGIKE